VCDYDRTGIACSGCQLLGDITHTGKAHFGEKIEVVLVDDNYAGPMLPERFSEAGFGVLQHGIEDGYGYADGA
jgi:hypothetical protein